MRGIPRTTVYPISFLMLLVAAAACVDDIPVTSPEEVTKEEVTEPAGNQHVVASVTCTAHVGAGELSCGEVPVVDGESGLQRVILGGQGVYVDLISIKPPFYDPATEVFWADVYLRNRIPQGLGSPDGIETTGIRVFTHSGPTVLGTGTGVVTDDSTDGTGDFTGVMQPYRLYTGYVPGLDPPFIYITATKRWFWTVPTTVDSFAFEVFVSADVVGEDGFVSMSPGSLLMSMGGGTQTVTGTALDVVGRLTGSAVTYSTSDPAVATVDAFGVVTPQGAGIVDIIGTTGGPETDGRVRVTVDPPTGGFDIDVHFVTPVSASQALAFNNAAARWESLITGDLPTEQVTIPFIVCGGLVDEYVDDLAINVVLDSIDGLGNTLGFAAPCWARSTGGLPAFGFMVFDTADVGLPQFGDVVLHEMGHVLGVGVLWGDYGLLNDDLGSIDDYDQCFPIADDPPPPLTTDPYFSGLEAIAAFDSTGGAAFTGNKVPVEDDWGQGTRCVHWRESVLDTEIMTGFVEAPAISMPLSAVTIKSLGDMGYTMATSGWDSFACPFCAPPALGAAAVDATAGGLQLINDVWLGPMYSRDAQGRVIEVRPDRRR